MKATVLYDQFAEPPKLTMYITGCPHKRQIREVLQKFREDLLAAARRQIAHAVDLPIDHPIDMELTLVNPASPDLDHLLEAIFMAMDGKSLKGPSILVDDRHVQKVTMRKFYPNEATKADNNR